MTEGLAQTEVALSAPVAQEAVAAAAHVASSGLPLAAGLRASALESDSRSVRRALLSLAAELERGSTLEQCLAKCRGLPREFRGAVAAANRSGAYSPLLVQWLADRRAAKARWRSFIATFSYPALALALAIAVFLFFAVFVVPVFRRMYEEFGLKLPAFTLMTLGAAEAGSRILFAMVTVTAVSAVALRVVGGAVGWSLILTSMPIIGLPWHWSSVAEALRMLGLLVEHRVPLPEALRLTAGALSDAYVARQLRILSDRVEQGTSLTMSLVRLRTLPLSIVPLVRWGERHGELAEGLRAAAQMIEGRMNVRTDVLLQVIPPVLLIFVGAMALSMTVGLFLPLISLIQGLS
jgi:type II secretory pathway component PulF